MVTLRQDITARTGRALEMTETIRDLLRTAGFRPTNTVSGTDTLGHEVEVRGCVLPPLHLGSGWEMSKINQTAETMKKQLSVPIESYIPSLSQRATTARPLADSKHHHLDSFQHPEQLVRLLTAASVTITHVISGLGKQAELSNEASRCELQ